MAFSWGPPCRKVDVLLKEGKGRPVEGTASENRMPNLTGNAYKHPN